MSEVTFITHLKYDHEDRVRNFQTILNYYSVNVPNSRFIVIEDDKQHNKEIDKIKWPKNTSFFFIKNEQIYHRTRALNFGLKESKTPITVSLDTDCIIPIDSFNKCVNKLLDSVTIAWPYNGYFIDVSYRIHQKFVDNNYNYSSLIDPLPPINTLKLRQMIYETYSVRCTSTEQTGVGGVVMFNTDRIKQVGGYNEKLIAWGAEDSELQSRASTLGYETFRDESLNAVCFHLPHRNVMRNNHPYYQNNLKEKNNVEKMTREQLLEYISTWKKL